MIAAKEVAKKKYAKKVCGYLGLPEEKCYDEFEKLYRNMRLAIAIV